MSNSSPLTPCTVEKSASSGQCVGAGGGEGCRGTRMALLACRAAVTFCCSKVIPTILAAVVRLERSRRTQSYQVSPSAVVAALGRGGQTPCRHCRGGVLGRSRGAFGGEQSCRRALARAALLRWAALPSLVRN